MRFYKCTYYVKTTFTLNKKWGNYDMGFVSATTVSLDNYGIRFIKKIENQDNACRCQHKLEMHLWKHTKTHKHR